MLSITPSVTQPNYEKKLAQSQGEKPATTIGNRTIGNNSLPEIRPSSSPTQQRMGAGPNAPKNDSESQCGQCATECAACVWYCCCWWAQQDAG